MACKGEYYIQEEERNTKNQRKFRQLSREVCREIFDIPEDNRVIFAYEKLYNKETLIGGISFQLARKSMDSPGVPFDTEYYNQITFLFVKIDFQGMGIGRMLVHKTFQIMTNHSQRPIRVQSAESAIGFFEKMGFVGKGDKIESLCGARIFRFMYNMEKTCCNKETPAVT